MSAPTQPPTQSDAFSKCWTCRRRRVTCDGSRPTCFKCQKTGRHCLGYGQNKPLVWVGLASRGKMAGRDFQDQSTSSSMITQLAAKTMSDPAFQDLGPRSKQYLFYYIHRCCIECTLYGDDSQNRFKQFLALMPSSPAITHSLIAISASHQAHSMAPIPKAVLPPATEGQPHLTYAGGDNLSCSDLALTRTSDALAHSTLSVGSLRAALGCSDRSDALVATIFLLVWLDLVDDGRTAWKQHLDGLKVLLSLRRHPTRIKSNSHFQRWFEETFAVISLFGSTFDPSLLQLLDIFPHSQLGEIFSKAETHSWSGCPSDLLGILYTFIYSAHGGALLSAQDVSQLFARLQDFDCMSWSAKSPEPSSFHARRSLAEAWKGAIEIYGRQVLGAQYPDFYRVPAKLVETTLDSIAQIPHDDTHFKGIVWPTFVAGAEAETPQQRQATRSLFGSLIGFLHLSTLHVAVSQLERIWARPSTYPPDGSWVKDIWERKEGLLLV